MLGVATMASTLVLVVIGAALAHLLIEPQAVWGASPGGAVGELLGEVLRSLLGFYGTVIIGFADTGDRGDLAHPVDARRSRCGCRATRARRPGQGAKRVRSPSRSLGGSARAPRRRDPREPAAHHGRDVTRRSRRASRADRRPAPETKPPQPKAAPPLAVRRSSRRRKPSRSLWRSRRVRGAITETSSFLRPACSTSPMPR